MTVLLETKQEMPSYMIFMLPTCGLIAPWFQSLIQCYNWPLLFNVPPVDLATLVIDRIPVTVEMWTGPGLPRSLTLVS